MRKACSILALVAIAIAGCGGGGGDAAGSATPQRAVEAFLAPLAEDGPRPGDEDARRAWARTTWERLCDRVDPAIRKALREGPAATGGDARQTCGALVALAAVDAGETSDVATPGAISGTARGAVTRGATSVVTVAMRYAPRQNATVAQPPARATVKVLAVRRDGSWFVATPSAVNARYAVRGGLSEAELREAHVQLLAAAR